jgi:hypothetical protein
MAQSLINNMANFTPLQQMVSQEDRSILWEVTVSVILSKEVYMYMCPIPNGLLDKTISLYSYKIIYKKEILRIVSNTSIYYKYMSLDIIHRLVFI